MITYGLLVDCSLTNLTVFWAEMVEAIARSQNHGDGPANAPAAPKRAIADKQKALLEVPYTKGTKKAGPHVSDPCLVSDQSMCDMCDNI